mmetsp:Transcript_32891/g.57486  ORF Transcript_32891/g.57486 Transcript_32891/m.57486 type:complete len:187 (-) Transcript_32891:2501-3061(-)
MEKLSKAQKDAKDYIELHNLEGVLKDMLNALVHSKHTRPEIYIIEYFSKRVSDADLKSIGLYTHVDHHEAPAASEEAHAGHQSDEEQPVEKFPHEEVKEVEAPEASSPDHEVEDKTEKQVEEQEISADHHENAHAAELSESQDLVEEADKASQDLVSDPHKAEVEAEQEASAESEPEGRVEEASVS